MNGYDFDGVLHPPGRFTPAPGDIVVTGRIACRENLGLIQSVVGTHTPIYMQPACREAGNRTYAGEWKATVCRLGAVDTFYEDDPVQAEVIRRLSPGTKVVLVGPVTPPPPVPAAARLPMVSCLMPTFGRAWRDRGMIEEAVWWFLRQDYRGPRELLVLCDVPGADLSVGRVKGVGEHLVRVVNRPRYPHLAAKFDALAGMADGSVLMPWEDDDISLPDRISRAVAEMERTGAAYYNPKGAFLQLGGAALSLCSPHSVHHNASAFTREAWRQVGGYSPAAGVGFENKQDAYMDRALRSRVPTFDGWVRPEQMAYVYRWNHSPACPHLSGHADPNAGYAAEWVPPPGPLHLTPARGRDYEAEAAAFVAALAVPGGRS